MKGMKAKLVSVLTAACLLVGLFAVMPGLAYTGEAGKTATFTSFTEERGRAPEITAMMNTPSATNDYASLYNWKPALGAFGKSADDTAFHFISKWDSPSLPTAEQVNESGVGYPQNPWFGYDVKVGELSNSDILRFSFEFARDMGANNFYAYHIGSGNVRSDTNLFAITAGDGATYDVISLMGQSVGNVNLAQRQWHKVDLVFHIGYEYAGDADISAGTYTAVDCYVDGDLKKEKVLFDADRSIDGYQQLESIDTIRINLDPRARDNVYPETNTYLDNISYEVLSADPQIKPTVLTHTDGTLNSYIDNANRTITSYGQTIAEMTNGLTGENDETIVVVDETGNPVSDTSQTLEHAAYVQVIASETDKAYYKIINRNFPVYAQGEQFVVDGEFLTVSGIHQYTPVSMLLQDLTVDPGYTASVCDADGGAVTADTVLKSGMKLRIAAEDDPAQVVQEFTIEVYAKAIDLSFDDWDVKFYKGSPSESGYMGYNFAGPTLAGIPDGKTAADVAYIETIDEPGRGKVLHAYSESDYSNQASYRHMNVTRGSAPTKAEIGQKFVMEMSAKCDEITSTGFQGNFMKKSGEENGLLNPLYLQNGSILAFGQVIGTYKPNEWYDIKVYCDAQTGEITPFINAQRGATVVSGQLKTFDYFTNFRLIQHFCTKDQIKNAYLDDIRVYGMDALTENFLDTMNTTLESDVFVVKGNSVNGFKGMTAGELISASKVAVGARVEVFAANGIDPVATDDFVQSGMILRVTTADGMNYKNYLLDVEAFTLSDIQYSINGNMIPGRFATGELKAEVDLTSYIDEPVPATVIIAQYENGRLINTAVGNAPATAKDQTVTVSATLNVTKSEGTTVKIMLLESRDTMKPLAASVDLTPFSDSSLESVQKLYPGYTQKAVTFSYDDLNNQDTQLIEIFDKYGLKGTFNLISNRFYNKSESEKQALIERYANHEVANHSETHPWMNPATTDHPDYLTLEECVENIRTGQEQIEEVFGRDASGFAWPYGAPTGREDYNELVEQLRQMGVKYARPTATNTDFALPTDWLDWRATCHHDQANNFVDEFLSMPNDGELKLFYVWGHTYELDETHKPEETTKMRWDDMEAFCAKFEGRTDVWKATNMEIHDYVEALKKLDVNYDTNTVTNQSDMDLYVQINGVNMTISAGEHVTL